jgi:SNF2 family DNA or RNA helicase
MPVIHTKGTFGICPGFKNHIISMSLLQKPDVFDSILEYGFKLIIVDESHSFKNEKAERTYSLQKIVETIPHEIFLSGTPIMNKVTEYFTVLNLLRPSHFPSKDSLVSKCDRAPNGRVLGISNHWRPRFFHQISEYVIRRTKKDAGIKLPNFRSLKRYVSIENNRKFVKEYNDLIDELDKTISAKRGDAGTSRHLLGLFAQFRHVVGLAKVEPVLQMVEEFMESTDPTDKITIGYYHKLVGDYLEKGLREYNPLRISDEPGLTKMNRIEEFKKPERRLLLASIKGAGQGLNIQFCKNAVVAEREWNPAREEQFINRFHRIEKNPDGTIKTEFDDAKDSVTVEFLNVAKTIDEFFDALVELKTHVVSATLEEEFAYDYDFLMDLAEKIVASRLYVSG